MIVPECVSERVNRANDMVCVSAHVELGRGPTQMVVVGRVGWGYFGNRAGSEGRCMRGPFRALRTAQARTIA